MSTLVETPGASMISAANENDINNNSNLNNNNGDNDSLNNLVNNESIGDKDTSSNDDNRVSISVDSNDKTGDQDINILNLDELKLEEGTDKLKQKNEIAQQGQQSQQNQQTKYNQKQLSNNDNSSAISVEEFIKNQLQQNPKDRLFMLNIESEIIKFIKNEKIESHKFNSMNTYYRMLVHKVCDYFGVGHNVDHNKNCVIVYKIDKTKIPSVSFQSILSSFETKNSSEQQEQEQKLNASSPLPNSDNNTFSSSSSSSNNNDTDAQQKINITTTNTSINNNQQSQKKQILKREVSDQDQNRQKNRANAKNNSEVRTKTFEEKAADYIKAKNRIFNSNNNENSGSASASDTPNEPSTPILSNPQHQYSILNRQNGNTKIQNSKHYHHHQQQGPSNQFSKPNNKNKNNTNYTNNIKQSVSSTYTNGTVNNNKNTKRISPNRTNHNNNTNNLNLAQKSTSNMSLGAQQTQQLQGAHFATNQIIYSQPYNLIQHHAASVGANLQLNSPMNSQTGYQQVITAAQSQYLQENIINSSQTPPTPQNSQQTVQQVATAQPSYYILPHPSYQAANVPHTSNTIPVQLQTTNGVNYNQNKQAQAQPSSQPTSYYINYINDVQQQSKNSPVQQPQMSLDPNSVYIQSNHQNYSFIPPPVQTATSHYVQQQQSQPQTPSVGNNINVNVRPNYTYMSGQAHVQPPPNSLMQNYPYHIINPQTNMVLAPQPIIAQAQQQAQQGQYQTSAPIQQTHVPLVPQPQLANVINHNLNLNGNYQEANTNNNNNTKLNQASDGIGLITSNGHTYRPNSNKHQNEIINNNNKINKQISKSYSSRETNSIKKDNNNNIQKMQRSSSNNHSSISHSNNPSLTVSMQLQQASLLQNQSLKLQQSASFNTNIGQTILPSQPMSFMYTNLYGVRAPDALVPPPQNQPPSQMQLQLNQPFNSNPNPNKPYSHMYQIPKQFNSFNSQASNSNSNYNNNNINNKSQNYNNKNKRNINQLRQNHHQPQQYQNQPGAQTQLQS